MLPENTLPSDPGLTDLESCIDKADPPISKEVKGTPPTEFTPAACLVLLGSTTAMFCTVGYINAFGVFQEYYQHELLSDKSPSAISWLGSFNLFVMFSGTFLVGYLNDKHGPRILLCIGSVTMLFALFMTSLCTQYWQLFLSQALLLGIGLSLVILPAFTTIAHYFVVSRGLAMGISVSGSSLGGVIWPIVLKNLLYGVGFGWGVRIIAFIMVPLLATTCLTIRQPKSQSNHVKAKPDMSVVKHPALIILAIAMFFIYLGLFSPFFYITSWTISRGLEASMGFYMVSIINAASLFGRILPGIWADKMGAFNVMIFSAGISGIICMCWTEATSMAGIVILSLAYGFSSGAVISLQGVCASQLVQKEQYGVAIGFMMSVISVAGLIGTPISGQLLDAFSYLGLSLFSGLAMVIGMLTLIAARLKTNSKVLAKA